MIPERSIIERLPDHCLEKIFGFLPIIDRVRVERVSLRWRSLAFGRHWKNCENLDLRRENWGFLAIAGKDHRLRQLDDSALLAVLRRCGRFVRGIDVYDRFAAKKYNLDFRSLSPSCLREALILCPRLERLRLDFNHVDRRFGNVVVDFLKNLSLLLSRNLTDVHLEGGWAHTGLLPPMDQNLSAVFRRSRNIRRLYLKKIPIVGQCLAFLNAENLEALSLIECIVTANVFHARDALEFLGRDSLKC